MLKYVFFCISKSVVEKVELQIQPNDSKEQDVTVVDSYKPVYGVEDVPPWYLCILLGFQVCSAVSFLIKR